MTSQTTPTVITRRNISTININEIVGKVVMIEKRLIYVPRERARSICPDEVLNEIKRIGIRTPVLVYYTIDFPKFVLVDGECRLRAIESDDDYVPAIIVGVIERFQEAVKRAKIESLVYSDKSLSSAQSIFQLLEDIYNEVCPNVKEIKIECCRRVSEEIERVTKKKLSEKTIKTYLWTLRKARELGIKIDDKTVKEAIEIVKETIRKARKIAKLENSKKVVLSVESEKLLREIRRNISLLMSRVEDYIQRFGVDSDIVREIQGLYRWVRDVLSRTGNVG